MTTSRLLPSLACLAGLLIFPCPAQEPPPERAIAVRPKATIPPEPRIALVIGNGAYREAPLANPVNDARAIGAALRRCGFGVTVLENATREQMGTALRDFGHRIAGGGVGLFYFAGHGMQVKGRNYLVPVNADVASEDEVAYNALDAEAVLAKMESAKNRLNIVILDACRNNPFGRSFRSGTAGLAQMDAPAGSYIAFATAPGKTASDGKEGNGLYTAHLLQALAMPGLKVEDTFKRVRAAVLQGSAGQQVPWESSSITGDFYFLPTGNEGSPTTQGHSAQAIELGFWNSIKDSRSPEDFEAYLKRYPDGAFADLARNRLKPPPVDPPQASGPVRPVPGGGRDRISNPTGAQPKGYLGVSIQELTEETRKQFKAGPQPGLLVVEVIKGSPAERMGMLAGDVIQSLRGIPVSNSQQFRELVGSLRPGGTVALGLLRNGVPRVMPFSPGVAPAPPSTPEPVVPPRPANRLRLTLEQPTPELLRRFGLPPGAEGLLVMGLDPAVTVRDMLPIGTLIQAVGTRALQSLEDREAFLPYAGAPMPLTVIRPGKDQPQGIMLHTAHGLVQP